ncbi:MAG: class II aldolase/adducin family protein [Betaproteobacteria bacterium]|nr:class II aldolase/adducin family protein [Betaproteobacteria bacterium]
MNHGKAGNVSARFLPSPPVSGAGHGRGRTGHGVDADSGMAAGFLITPTGLPYDQTLPADLAYMPLSATDEHDYTGPRLPSSEWRFHRDIYAARPEVRAIVHTHGVYATTLACLDRGIPAFHYMVAAAGGIDIRCAPYATFGTQELSDHALAALHERDACLLAHHGSIAVGPSLARALALAVEVEALARMYWQALQIGEPDTLPDAEMQRVLEKFRTYGQPRG